MFTKKLPRRKLSWVLIRIFCDGCDVDDVGMLKVGEMLRMIKAEKQLPKQPDTSLCRSWPPPWPWLLPAPSKDEELSSLLFWGIWDAPVGCVREMCTREGRLTSQADSGPAVSSFLLAAPSTPCAPSLGPAKMAGLAEAVTKLQVACSKSQ